MSRVARRSSVWSAGRKQQGTVGLLGGLVQLFAQVLLLNEDMDRRNKAVDAAGVVQHNLILKGDKLTQLLRPVDLLEQGQPESLAVALLAALALQSAANCFPAGRGGVSVMVVYPQLLFYRIP